MDIEKLSALLSEQPWEVESDGNCLNITSEEGVTVYLVSGETQILVETPLFAAKDVADTSQLNDMVLRTHHLVPLSTVCIKSISNEDYYIAFGSLSRDSRDTVIIEEIQTLFENVSEFLELYSQMIKGEKVA